MDTRELPRVGPKTPVHGKHAVCSTAQPTVTATILDVLKEGGNAIDAAVAGCLIQAAIEPHMTNHAGSVDLLYWENRTSTAHFLNGTGTLVADMAPFRPIPPIGIRFAPKEFSPCAAIPGFMPSLGMMHERFGTREWATLCGPAAEIADAGHVVTSFEASTLAEESRFFTYLPSGREFFTPGGFLPEAGDLFRNPALAKTMSRLAVEGPSYFTTGEWGQHFVAKANAMGWPITTEHMTAVPPRWREPLRYPHNEWEIIQMSPPERTGVFTALVMGILRHLDVSSLGHYANSAQALYYMAHALRRADWELGLLNDPRMFEVPTEQWLSDEFHALCADILRKSMPKVDLTGHFLATSSRQALLAAGVPTAGGGEEHPPVGSCEISIVDAEGNWVQMMNTLQGGGIPGAVVDGVPMVGNHARTDLGADIAGWFTGGERIRCIVGSTIVLKKGQPVLSLGSPGNVYGTVPQVLSSILDYGMSPYDATLQPRMDPLRNDYVVEMESRVPAGVINDLLALGVRVQPLPEYDYNMGCYQISWRDEATGLLGASTDPRRVGLASGL